MSVPQLVPPNPLLIQKASFKGVRKGVFSSDGNRMVLIGTEHFEVLEVLTKRRLFTISRKGVVILGANFSPDGRTLVTSEKTLINSQRERFSVVFWDGNAGTERLSLPVSEDQWYRNLSDVSFSSDSTLLASNLGGIPRLWHTSDGTEARRFVTTDEKELSTERVLISPDGNQFAVYLRGPTSDIIRVWNLSTKKQIDLLTDVYRDWTFSADSKNLVVTATQKKGSIEEHSAAEIWDLNTAKRVSTIETPRGWRGAYALDLSPDGSILAIGGYKQFGLFSVKTGQLMAHASHGDTKLFSDNEISNQLTSIQFSPDGTRLLTGAEDGTVKLWNVTK